MKGAADTTATRAAILDELKKLKRPDGGDLVSRDMVRAQSVEGATARFVIEAPSPAMAQQIEPPRARSRTHRPLGAGDGSRPRGVEGA